MAESSLINRKRVLFRSLAIWLVMMLAEIAHGILRAVLLVPLVGEFRSDQIGIFTGSAIILVIAYSTIRWIGAKCPIKPLQAGGLLLVGAIWLTLTVAFEILFGRLAMGLAWNEVFAGYNIANGGLMPLGLLVLFFSPIIAAKMHEKA